MGKKGRKLEGGRREKKKERKEGRREGK